MNKRQQQRNDRRQQILECALDMIIRRGFAATTIRDIAKKLNISTGLFFNYFESKEQIYVELVKIGMDGPKCVLEQLSDTTLPPIGALEKITEDIFKALRTDSFTAKMFFLMPQTMNSEGIPDSVKEIVSKFDAMTPILPVIVKGQQLGQIKTGDPVALGVAFWSAIQGIAQSLCQRSDIPLPESRWIVDILRV